MNAWTGLVFTYHRIIFLLHCLTITMTATLVDYDYQDDEQPSFLPRPTNVSFNRGETAVLVCGIENIGPRTVIWRRASDPNPLTIGSDVYVGASRYSADNRPDDQEWRLVINDVRDSDAGVYECQVSSKRKLIQHVLLRVLSGTPRPDKDKYLKQEQNSPVIIQEPGIFMSGSKFVEKGDPIHLSCNTTGQSEAPEDLDWFKDGIKLTPDGLQQIKIEKFHVHATRTLVSTIVIKHSRMEDAGTYVCRSSNLSMTSTKVHVLNAGSVNVRRGTSATDKAGQAGNKELNDNDAHNEAITNAKNCSAIKSSGHLLSRTVVLLRLLLVALSVHTLTS